MNKYKLFLGIPFQKRNYHYWVSYSFMAIFFMLFGVNPVFAGGGLVEWTQIKAGNGGYFVYPGEAYIVTARVRLTNGNYCKQCPIRVRLKYPRENDIFNPTSDKTDDNGEVTVKIVSNVPEIRTVYAEVTLPDGTVYTSSSAILNFTGKLLYWTYDGYKTPEEIAAIPKIHVDIPAIEITDFSRLINNNQRIVTFKVTGPKDTLLDIWAKADGEEYQDNASGAQTSSGVAWAYVDAKKNYTFKARSCNEKACSDFGNEVSLSLGALAYKPTIVKQNDISSNEPASITPPQVFISKLNSSSETAQLNKKINDLQNQLEQSKQKQNTLEQRITDLVNFIKSLFPFFK